MEESITIDEAIDVSLDLLESSLATGRVEQVVTWVVDNLICELDVLEAGAVSQFDVSGYVVTRIGDQIAVVMKETKVLDSHEARRLAVALLRAAEAAERVL